MKYVYLVYDTMFDTEELVAAYCDRQTALEAIGTNVFYTIRKIAVRYQSRKIKR